MKRQDFERKIRKMHIQYFERNLPQKEQKNDQEKQTITEQLEMKWKQNHPFFKDEEQMKKDILKNPIDREPYVTRGGMSEIEECCSCGGGAGAGSAAGCFDATSSVSDGAGGATSTTSAGDYQYVKPMGPVLTRGSIYNPQPKKKKKKKINEIYITESQVQYIKENMNFVDTNKVLIVKKFLDDNFVRAQIPIINNQGYADTMFIVGMKGTDGNVIKNMTAQQLLDLLIDHFQKIYGDKNKRYDFLKLVMKDWYNKKINNNGMMSVNRY